MMNRSIEVLDISSCGLSDSLGEILIFHLNKREKKLERFLYDNNYFTQPVVDELGKLHGIGDDFIISLKQNQSNLAKSFKSVGSIKKSIPSEEKHTEEDEEDISSDIVSTSSKISRNVKVIREINPGGGSGATIHEVLIDGWTCAMKQIPIDDEHTGKTLISEIKVLQALPYHPNIVTYLFHEIKFDQIRLFTTLYHSTLRRVIKEKRFKLQKGSGTYFFPWEITNYSLEILKGLKYLHQKKITHRDLKTANIFVMIDQYGDITHLAIGDFDSARKLTTRGRANTFTGTTDYMAPEVISDTPYTKAIDIWSFGMLLYEMITLKRPYSDQPITVVPNLIQSGTRPSIDPSFIDQYFELIDLFELCTEKEPELRPTIDFMERTLQTTL